MNTLGEWLDFVTTTLQTWPHCHNVRILETQQFSNQQFALKVRAELIPNGILQVRLYCNHGHTDYAYHVIYEQYTMRWDNKEHFPTLSSFPHHFHMPTGQVEASPLIGRPIHDLPWVLDQLVQFLDHSSPSIKS